MAKKTTSVLPGFRLTLGYTVLYLSLIVLIPLACAFWKTSELTWGQFWHAVAAPRVLASYRLSFGASFLAALTNLFFGLLVAWVLVRYQFWGKRFVDALVDLPFALPTAVAGIALTAVYAPHGWIGQWLEPLGIQVAFTRLGVFVAFRSGPALRAADGGGRHRADGGVCAARLDRPMARTARNPGCLHAARRIRCAHVHRVAVHCPHRADRK